MVGTHGELNFNTRRKNKDLSAKIFGHEYCNLCGIESFPGRA